MIYIDLCQLDFESELLDLIKLFYNKYEIMKESLTTPEPSDAVLKGGLSDTCNGLCYNLNFSTSSGMSEYSIPLTGKIPGKSEITQRKAFKREIKRGIYRLFSEALRKELPWGILTGIRPAKIVHELMEEGLSRQETIRKLTGYYFLSGEKSRLLYEVASTEKIILDSSPDDSVSIYIGIPFCPSRCLYCSFTSYSAARYAGYTGKYLEALKYELDCIGKMLEDNGRRVQSIYMGGGTPTAISAEELEDLLRHIESCFNLNSLQEFTIEAGRPDSIDEEKLAAIRNSRADRISINPQTMNDETLKLIGRHHSSRDLVHAYGLARGMGFDNINMDVIIGLPGESVDDFEYTLKKICDMKPDSLTVHTMAIKRASRLNEERDTYSLATEKEASAMIELAGKYAGLMGLHPYYLYRQKNMLGNLENIGYCRPGSESIYNVQIMEEKQTIIAAGAGAITKVVYPGENRIERAFNVKSVEEYVSRIEEMVSRKKVLLEAK